MLTDDWLADELSKSLRGKRMSEDQVKEFVLTETPFYRYKDRINILRKRGIVSPTAKGKFPVTFVAARP